MKLVVVDDSSTMRRIIKNTLARLGYKDILEGEDGVQGWDVLNSNPDTGMLITDWNMPEMNGLELVKKFVQTKGLLICQSLWSLQKAVRRKLLRH